MDKLVNFNLKNIISNFYNMHTHVKDFMDLSVHVKFIVKSNFNDIHAYIDILSFTHTNIDISNWDLYTFIFGFL